MSERPLMDVSTAAANAWRATRMRINKTKKEKPAGLSYPIEVTLRGEPRIAYLKMLLELALSLGVFTKDGKPVVVDGFRLRDVTNWTTNEKPSPEEIFELLSTRCAVNCEFCYLRMDPVTSVTKFNVNTQTDVLADIDFRQSLAEANKKLFSPTFQMEEVVGNPYFCKVAKKMRLISDRVFFLNTTGYGLDSGMLTFLEGIEPVEIRVSLNAIDPLVRHRVMRDTKGTILPILGEMRDRGMRFSVSVVMWPSIAWEELESTIRFADECRPYGIFAILPGFTTTFSKAPLGNPDAYWLQIVEKIAELRHSIASPLIVHPRLYEEVALNYPPNEAVVIGVTPGSPAAMAGLRIGDIVRGVDEFNSVWSRRQLSNLLTIKHSQQPNSVRLFINRGGRAIELTLPVKEAYCRGYPHRPPFEDQFGVNLISQGIALSDLREVSRLASSRGTTKVGIATSSIVFPGLQDLIHTWGPTVLPGLEIIPFVPENRFYGGNICLGELMTASDIATGIGELLHERPDVEQIIVPSPAFAPGGWWRDLEGVPFTRLRATCPVPVDLLVCSPFE